MSDLHPRNSDEDRQGISADSYHIGESEDDLVIALCVPQYPADVGVFLDRKEALEFLGRFTHEMRQKGWLP